VSVNLFNKVIVSLNVESMVWHDFLKQHRNSWIELWVLRQTLRLNF